MNMFRSLKAFEVARRSHARFDWYISFRLLMQMQSVNIIYSLHLKFYRRAIVRAQHRLKSARRRQVKLGTGRV